jgi:hypothetical protein
LILEALEDVESSSG